RVLVAEEPHIVSVHLDRVAFRAHGRSERAERRVVLQQVSERPGVADVVDGDDLEVGLEVPCRAIDVAADAAEAVDAYLDCHAGALLVSEGAGNAINVRRSGAEGWASGPPPCVRLSAAAVAAGDSRRTSTASCVRPARPGSAPDSGVASETSPGGRGAAPTARRWLPGSRWQLPAGDPSRSSCRCWPSRSSDGG